MIREPRRLVAAALAIVLGVAFATITLVTGDSLTAGLRAQLAGEIGSASVVVRAPEGAALPPAAVDEVGRVPGVTAARTLTKGVVIQQTGTPAPAPTQPPAASEDAEGGEEEDQESLEPVVPLQVRSLPARDAFTLVSGRLPLTADEAVVNDVLARGRKANVGETVRFGHDNARAVRVVGVVAPDPRTVPQVEAEPYLFGAETSVRAWLGKAGPDVIMVDGIEATEQARAAVAGVPSLAGSKAQVRTAEADVDAALKDHKEMLRIITGMLFAFAAIAIFVAAMVIANTFSVLVAQRTRQLALLRCVGATRGQVFRDVVTEAGILAAVASVAGVGVGVGVTAAAIAVWGGSGGVPLEGVAVSGPSLAVPFAIGVVITLVAALLPARRATRVAPIAALRPLTSDGGQRASIVRLVLGTVLAVAGFAALAYAGSTGSLPLGVAAGLTSFTGVLVLGPVLVPALVRVVGALPARAGVSGGLAVDNARRNPQRAAATASALVIGVTLVSMLLVGAATTRATTDRAMDRQFITDAQVQGPPPGIDAAHLDKLKAVKGVRDARAVRTSPVTMTVPGSPPVKTTASGVPDGIEKVVRTTTHFRGLAEDAIVLHPDRKVPDGARVTLAVGQTARTLRAVVHTDAGQGAVVTEATLKALAPDAAATAWVRFTDDANIGDTMEGLRSAVSDLPGAQVGGAAAERAEMKKILDGVVAVALALTAVAVLIAVVGIGNTLGLAVLERRREFGLLRALGLSRSRLRMMLGVEAVVLAGVAVLLGVALGIAYGITGIRAVVGTGFTVIPEVPWVPLGLVVGFALLAGWVASVLPGLRAARTSPSAALAEE